MKAFIKMTLEFGVYRNGAFCFELFDTYDFEHGRGVFSLLNH